MTLGVWILQNNSIHSDNQISLKKSQWELLMVPRAGLEPAHRKAEDFETSVSTIPPSGQIITNLYFFPCTPLECRPTIVETRTPRVLPSCVLLRKGRFGSMAPCSRTSTIPPSGQEKYLPSIEKREKKANFQNFSFSVFPSTFFSFLYNERKIYP